jgi:hypothetical protein
MTAAALGFSGLHQSGSSSTSRRAKPVEYGAEDPSGSQRPAVGRATCRRWPFCRTPSSRMP